LTIDTVIDNLQCFSALLFDLDQTLFDLNVYWKGIKDHFNAYFAAQHHHSLPYNTFWQNFDYIVSIDGKQGLEYYIKYLQTQEFAESREHATPTWLMSSGFFEILSHQNLSPFIGIISSNFHKTIKTILKNQNAQKYFQVIIGQDDVERPKPDPEGILQVLRTYKLNPENTVYIGDMDSDAQTAQAAKVKFIFIQDLEQLFKKS
jgi:phosphoglycolate phosphatase-like HAD superfamily hydrolase